MCLCSSGNNELGIIDLQKALVINPNNADAYLWFGNAFANSKKFQQAISAHQNAIALSNDAYTYCVLGVTYTKITTSHQLLLRLKVGYKWTQKMKWVGVCLHWKMQNKELLPPESIHSDLSAHLQEHGPRGNYKLIGCQIAAKRIVGQVYNNGGSIIIPL